MGDTAGLELRANRMDIVARWADDLAHEIKNPLHAMVINLELVKRRAAAGVGDAVVERAEIVEAEIQRVHGLIDSLLRLVRPWPDRAVVELDVLFQDLLPVIEARSHVRRIEYSHEPGGGSVAIGAGPLGLILLNLVDNAMDVTPPDGRVITRCEGGDERVRIHVVDSGAGLPDALRAAAPVEVGETGRAGLPGLSDRPADPGRHGLGLAISARLARAAGGTLSLQPGPDGTGTAAIVTLPRAGSA